MSEHEQGYHGLEKVRRKEYAILVAADFEAVEGGLWQKEGTMYGKGAALQNVREKLCEGE